MLSLSGHISYMVHIITADLLDKTEINNVDLSPLNSARVRVPLAIDFFSHVYPVHSCQGRVAPHEHTPHGPFAYSRVLILP